MGRDRHYVPGDFYRVDDRTGFPERAKRTRKEWTGLIVHRDRWEARQPQDFVKGVFDDQTVPEPRPLPSTDPMVGPLEVTLVPPPTFVPPPFSMVPNGTNFIYGPGSGDGFLSDDAGNNVLFTDNSSSPLLAG